MHGRGWLTVEATAAQRRGQGCVGLIPLAGLRAERQRRNASEHAASAAGPLRQDTARRMTARSWEQYGYSHTLYRTSRSPEDA